MPRPYAGVVLDGLRSGTVLYCPQSKRVLIKGPEDVYEHLKPLMGSADKEIFVTLALNARNQVRRVFVISVGSLNASIVHPREVFSPLIRDSAAAAILAHNHPSGETDPSEDDLALTRRLVQVGELCGIAIMDHIIVGSKSFYSLKQNGFL